MISPRTAINHRGTPEGQAQESSSGRTEKSRVGDVDLEENDHVDRTRFISPKLNGKRKDVNYN